MAEEKILTTDLCNNIPPELPAAVIDTPWQEAVKKLPAKIIVLDDDPTGVQTVHSVPVYTAWEKEDLERLFHEPAKVVYILTNSRALTAKQTQTLHQELIANLIEISTDFLLISRSDSTLRGHYPLETETLYEGMKARVPVAGEIVAPFFYEGGRLTYQDIHYVREGDWLIPAGQTEFAKDPTFGYSASNLREWIAEKTGGRFPAEEVISISLDTLRNNDIEAITRQLTRVNGFNKVIVNAVNYSDLKVFLVALAEAAAEKKRFIIRSAASLVQIAGGIQPKPLLTKNDVYSGRTRREPGLIIIGSHVAKTTRQFEQLKSLPEIDWIEWDVREAASDEAMERESARVANAIAVSFQREKDVCVYTTREYRRVDENQASEANLLFSTRVSQGLVGCVQKLQTVPGYLIAKGGITSSDIGVKGLGVRRAVVMGQILPGIPVWETGPESRWPGLPYIIFPGNVGADDALKKVVATLRGEAVSL